MHISIALTYISDTPNISDTLIVISNALQQVRNAPNLCIAPIHIRLIPMCITNGPTT